MTNQTTDQTAPKARKGRQSKDLFVGKRRTHTIRLREEVRKKLMAVSRESGLSMSEEAERRIEASFGTVDQLATLLGHIIRMGQALTGRPWEEDRYTRELCFGLIVQRLGTMMDDPQNALLVEEARQARE